MIRVISCLGALVVWPSLLLALVLMLGGCGEGAEAERAYRIAAPADKCRAATVAAERYLMAGDEANYRTWSTIRDLDCTVL
jgi:hypothetical protein